MDLLYSRDARRGSAKRHTLTLRHLKCSNINPTFCSMLTQLCIGIASLIEMDSKATCSSRRLYPAYHAQGQRIGTHAIRSGWYPLPLSQLGSARDKVMAAPILRQALEIDSRPPILDLIMLAEFTDVMLFRGNIMSQICIILLRTCFCTAFPRDGCAATVSVSDR